MELEKEFIETNKLSEEQVSALSGKFDSLLADEKKALEESFKGEANKNAEGILSGAASLTEKQTGVKRNEGEKLADYLNRAASEYLVSKQKELDSLKGEYEEKVKKASGTDIEAIKKEYQTEKDELLKKFADYDELKEKASKADEYGEKLSGLKLQVAYSNVKPVFPDTVNQYEAKAKWDEFVKGVNEKYNIELDESNEAVYIDKENKFKTGKLADLVKADETISELVKGRQQGGLGGKEVKKVTVDGIPFTIDENASNEQISKSIKEYLISNKKLDILSEEYAKQFSELHSKIKKQKTAA